MTLYPLEGSGRTSAAFRWAAAAAIVIVAHAGAGWWIVTHPIGPNDPPQTVQGITIDLEPVAVPQNAPDPNATMASGAATVPRTAAAPDPTPAPQPDPPPPEETKIPPEPAPPEPVPSPPPTPIPPPAPVPPPVDAPPPPTAPEPPPPEPSPMTAPPAETKSDAVLAPPAPPPKPVLSQKPPPPKPDPRKVAREAAARKALVERREAQRLARAEVRAQATKQAAERREGGGQSNQTAAASSASSGASVSSWRGEVVAHLNAYKPASPNGATGTARVSFSVDRAGRVVAASLAGSSGERALDEAALAMVRRASPVPAPPMELGGRVSLSVPVRFH